MDGKSAISWQLATNFPPIRREMVVSGGSWMAPLHKAGRKSDPRSTKGQTWGGKGWGLGSPHPTPRSPHVSLSLYQWKVTSGHRGCTGPSIGALLPQWPWHTTNLPLGPAGPANMGSCWFSVPRTVWKFFQGNWCGGLMSLSPGVGQLCLEILNLCVFSVYGLRQNMSVPWASVFSLVKWG